MKDLTALVLIVACVTGARLHAQTAASTPKPVAAAPESSRSRPKQLQLRQRKSQRNNQTRKRTNRLTIRYLARALRA